MAIAEQFAGLRMDQLIGGPLSAAADASTLLANSTASFINRVGFDNKGNVRNVAFGYQRRTPNEDGTSSIDEMKVSVPLLAIVPIPNLQIDEVNILFDMEVKQSERSESSLDMGATLDASAKIGCFKVNVSGSVSSHQSNTRSTDNSAKYHVDVRATNHGTPEGLARVLDMMAANVAPALVSSSLKDGNGQELSEKERLKAERVKQLRNEISQIESRLTAAQDGLSASLTQFKRIADTQLNNYRELMSRQVNKIDPEQYNKEIKDAEKAGKETEIEAARKKKADAEKEVEKYSEMMEEVNSTWATFQNQVGGYVKMIADSTENGKLAEVSEVFGLKALKKGQSETELIAGVDKYVADESQYKAMLTAQNNAVDRQKNVDAIETELADKRAEYNDAMSGKALPDKGEASSTAKGQDQTADQNK